MIVYQSTKALFQEHVLSGEIEEIILGFFKTKLQRSTSSKEISAWRNSLLYMDKVLSDKDIPDESGVAIECQIPQTAKRIDFLLTGYNGKNIPHVIIIELKQWTSSELTDKDGVIKTVIGGGLRETSHPSYQAWSYSRLLEDFSEVVYSEKISLKPCAFLHNYISDNVIANPFYKKYTDLAPVFLKKDMASLRSFIKQFLSKGDNGETLFRIDNGQIKPSKQLSESLHGMIKGNKEFVLIDNQKLVYETALSLTNRAKKEGKKVLIVNGGPGTGKSVVAINLLVEITRREMLVQYVTKNAAPRAVYQSKLEGTLTKKRFDSLFQGSGRFTEAQSNVFDTLVVDEAHRLNAKSGMFQNLGENQIKEIINASKCAVFFLDEDQKVTLKDIGSKDEIKKWAKIQNAELIEMELDSQFRCNGSDGYLSWIDNVLQIRNTANTNLEGVNYDFRVLDSPSELRDLIFEKNKESNKARLVAGYCWDWASKNNIKITDINFPEYDFAMPWNFSTESYLWSIKPDSVKEIGCIHTCQGLEMDYVGVILGPDIICRDGHVLVDPSKRAKSDSSIRGYKSLMKSNPEEGKSLVKKVILNTYRTLMTRGMKACYIYSTDKETNEWFKKNI